MKLRTWIAFASFAVLMGCGNGGDVDKLKKMKDEVCACRTADCVDKVNKDNEALKKSFEDKYKGAKSKDDIPKEVLENIRELEKCARDVRDANRDSAAKGETNVEASELIAKLEGFRDRMCACAAGDTKCAEAVSQEYTRWTSDAKNMTFTPDPAMTNKMMDITKAFSDCMTKAMTPS